MCGIGGIINLSKRASKLNLESISTIRKMISKRGPDQNGNWISKDKDVVFTIQRLATQDKRIIANQPCFSSDKNILAIMNGEIYNQVFLRNFLKDKGYKFISLNDTEVIANAYHYWGKEFLLKIKGQFAIVVHDIKKKRGIIARDKHGICPLYYFRDSNKIIFSSTVDSIFHENAIKLDICKRALSDYIISGCSVDGNTIYKDIKYLTPGNYFEFKISEDLIEREFVNRTDFLNYKSSHYKYV